MKVIAFLVCAAFVCLCSAQDCSDGSTGTTNNINFNFNNMFDGLEVSGSSSSSDDSGSSDDSSSDSSDSSSSDSCSEGSSTSPFGKLYEICPRDIAEVQNRLEIKDLSWKQYSLMVQAFQRMYDEDTKSEYSYFLAASIHSSPYVAYNNTFDEELGEWYYYASDGSAMINTRRQGSYCNHGNTLFPTWHRAYIAHFETLLQWQVGQAALDYDDVDGEWACAALEFRLPYWDWSDKATVEEGPPTMFTDEEVTIEKPLGLRSVSNPLYAYEYQQRVIGEYEASNPYYFSVEKGNLTSRWPGKDHNPLNDIPAFIKGAKRIAANCTQPHTYKMLIEPSNYECFAVLQSLEDNEECDTVSIEFVHDLGHRLIGGSPMVGSSGSSGTMSDNPNQSYDPLFFFHHANLDRHLAIWQVLNPDEWLVPFTDDGMTAGTFTRVGKEIVDAESDLTPFYKTTDEFFNSDDVRHWREMSHAYDYPETSDMPDRETLLQRIEDLYNYDGFWSGDIVGVCPYCDGRCAGTTC